MSLGLLAKKVGMTQVFTDEGILVPVTVLKVEPNYVVTKKSEATDGYCAVQVASMDIRQTLVNKPKAGHFTKSGVQPKRMLKEFRVDEKQLEAVELGAPLGLELLAEAKSVDVAGVSKGKGYAGVMKRHNFAGFPAAHGTHEFFRHGGSIGMRAQPGKVLKGKRMSGHMGSERVTVKNLRVIRIMQEEGLLLLRGAIPGGKGQAVEIYVSKHEPRSLGHIGGAAIEEASKNPMKASKAGAGKKK